MITFRLPRIICRLLGAVMVAGVMSGCAAPSSYMGIDLNLASANTTETELQLLARKARAGDKRAQLYLGIRFEEGVGIAADLEKARALYELAAKNTPIRQTSFIPEGATVKAETISAGIRPGLREAKVKLSMLNDLNGHGRHVKFFYNPENLIALDKKYFDASNIALCPSSIEIEDVINRDDFVVIKAEGEFIRSEGGYFKSKIRKSANTEFILKKIYEVSQPINISDKIIFSYPDDNASDPDECLYNFYKRADNFIFFEKAGRLYFLNAVHSEGE